MNFLLVIFLLVFNIFDIDQQLKATSLNGTSSIIYETNPYVLHNGEFARGFVALKKGFTVPTLQGARLNLSIPVSYGMDLRSTGSIVLENDLRLDSGFTLSSSGTINGGGYALILNDDLIIPELSTLKITSTLTIEGNGHTIYFDNFAQILADSHSTLTLRNLVIQNFRNAPGQAVIAAKGSDTKIAFDNTTFVLNDDYHINLGSFFFHNDVIFTGNAQLFYRSPQKSFIAPQSTLTFDNGSSLYYCPPSQSKDLLTLQDSTSYMYFGNSDFISTPTGITLSEGNILLEDSVTIGGGVSTINAFMAAKSKSYGIQVKSFDWSPNGEYLAVAGNGAINGAGGFNNTDQIRIYKLDISNMDSLETATSMPYGGTLNSIAWSPSGEYLAVAGSDALPIGGFDNADAIRVYRFDTVKEELYAVTSAGYGTGCTVNIVSWHTSGKYLSIAGDQPTLGSGGFSDQNNIRIYFFDEIEEQLQPFASATYDTGDPSSVVTSINWHNSGLYLATAGSSTTPNLRIFYFDTYNSELISRLTLYYENATNVTNPKVVSFSPEGRFLFIGGQGAGSVKHIEMLKFDTSIYPPTSSFFSYGMGTAANEITSAKWHPNGKNIVFGNNHYLSGYAETNVCKFDYNASSALWTFDFVSNQIYGQTVYATLFNPIYDFLAVGGEAATTFGNKSNTDEIQMYRFLIDEFDLVNSVINTITVGGGTYASSWSTNGRYLATGVYQPATGDQINLYSFNSASNATDLLDSKAYGTNVNSVAWCHGNQYLAVTGYAPASGGGFANTDHIRIYKIQNNLLTAVTSQPIGTATAYGYVVAWHQSGKYLAVGSSNAASGYGGFANTDNVRIYSFDGTTLTALTSVDFGTECRDLCWSQDGKKLLACGVGTGSPRHDVVVYAFNDYSSLQKIVGEEYGSGTPSALKAKWNIDEQTIAITGSTPDNVGGFTSSDVLRIYRFYLNTLTPVASSTISSADIRWTGDGVNLVCANESDGVVVFYYDGTNLNLEVTKNMRLPIKSITGYDRQNFLCLGGSLQDESVAEIYLYKTNKYSNIYSSMNTMNLNGDININVLGGANVRIGGVVNYAE